MYPPPFSIDALYLLTIRVLASPFCYSVGIGLLFYNTSPYLAYFSGVAAGLKVLVSVLFPFLESLQGGPPRSVDFQHEVVVVTGGSRGLGRILVDLFAGKGAKVAVLDVTPFGGEGQSGNFMFLATDVGDEKAMADAQRIIAERFGTPTILVNNAGIVNGKALLDLSSAEVERNFRVNLLSHFHSIRAFLPRMLSLPNGATIVTVSSVLGNLGAAQLSDYTAAKAGLMAMHSSLRAELDAAGNAKIKTVLVKPGQLSTPLFSGVKTPSSFFGPVVEAEDLAERIVNKIASGKSVIIALPLYAEYIEWMSVLPFALQGFLRKMSGVDQAMRSFKAK